MGRREHFQGGCVGGRLTTKPTELQRRPYLCQREVTPSILLLNTDHLCCYLPCCQIPGRCSPGLWSGHLRDSLSQSAGCTKSPFRGAKTGSSHTTCFLKQHVLISLLQHVQDMRLGMNSSTSIARQITLERKKRRGGNTLFPLRVKNNEASFLPMFSSSCYKLKATRTST